MRVWKKAEVLISHKSLVDSVDSTNDLCGLTEKPWGSPTKTLYDERKPQRSNSLKRRNTRDRERAQQLFGRIKNLRGE